MSRIIWRSAFATLVLAAACAPPPAASPTATRATSASATGSPIAVATGLVSAPHAIVGPVRAWYLVPDGLSHEMVHIAVTFPDGDPSQGTPRVRLRSNGRVVALQRTPTLPSSWQAELPLDGVVPGEQRAEIIVRLIDGQDAAIGQRDFKVSMPEYVVWTLDFEGDAAGSSALSNTAAIADSLKVPMTLMWNPRVWTTPSVSAATAGAMLEWTKMRAGLGDEIALHLHAWVDFVAAAGVAPRLDPNWAGRRDGYDVPITAFDESETRKLIDHALKLMAEHGLPRPTSFRCGGLFANAANLRAIDAAGFTADTSAAPAGPFGKLLLPWSLPKDAQPYRPSSADANAAGDLRILEVPNIAGNTFGYDARSIQSVIRDDLSMLAPAGQVAATRRALTFVSHPGTIDESERGAIEALIKSFAPLRYDADTGPLRFITLAQLAKAYAN